MKNVMGVIYTGENDVRLRELTQVRAIAALPVAGRYRVIDFLVSSMVNSGIKNVGVIMQKNYHSLMDHLGSGKEWDLHGKNDGLHILPPFIFFSPSPFARDIEKASIASATPNEILLTKNPKLSIFTSVKIKNSEHVSRTRKFS